MNPSEKLNFENTAYEQLKLAILKGLYPPGAQIIEETIASQLNMSRSPVRSAIKRLEVEGFLEKRTNRRMYVTHGNITKTINALYIRKALEGVAAYQAALNRTEEDIQNLQAILDQMKVCDDSFKLLRLGTEIHKLIYIASKNTQLANIGTNILDQVSISSYRSLSAGPTRIHESYVEHAALAEAVFAQDANLAEQKAREHIDILIDRAIRSYNEEDRDNDLLISY